MKRDELRVKLTGIKRGEKVRITPMSTKNGDLFTTLAIPGFGPAKEHIEIHEPFYARLDSFDGETLVVTSEQHNSLRISYEELKDVSVLIHVPHSTSNTLLF